MKDIVGVQISRHQVRRLPYPCVPCWGREGGIQGRAGLRPQLALHVRHEQAVAPVRRLAAAHPRCPFAENKMRRPRLGLQVAVVRLDLAQVHGEVVCLAQQPLLAPGKGGVGAAEPAVGVVARVSTPVLGVVQIPVHHCQAEVVLTQLLAR